MVVLPCYRNGTYRFVYSTQRSSPRWEPPGKEMEHAMIGQRGKSLSRTWGIPLVAVLMILFGAAEVVTGFTHRFVGISTSSSSVFTAAGVAIGLCYVVAGVLILTRRLWAA